MRTSLESVPESERTTIDDARSPNTITILRTLVRRELSTAVINRTTLGFFFGLVAVLFAIAWFGGGMGAGYISTIIDLLTPLQLLIPVIALVFGYQAILGDKRRGVLAVLRTYPVASWQIILGVYVGRAIGLAAVISVALSFLIYPILLIEPYSPVFYATHTGVDSPMLFLRFIVLTTWFALVMLAVAVAISALAGTARTALALTGLVLLAVLFLADIALVFALSRGMIDEASLLGSLAISPLSAYRGLVLETTVAATSGTGPRAASPLASVVGLFGWWLGSLAIATLAVRK